LKVCRFRRPNAHTWNLLATRPSGCKDDTLHLAFIVCKG